MAQTYEYRTAGRSTLTVLGFAMMLAAVLISALDGAGWIAWSLWGLATLGLSHHLLSCQVAGLRLDGTTCTVFTDRRHRQFALARIERAVLTDCRNCRCACTLHFTDGTRMRLPARCLPPAATLAKSLRRYGVTVVIDRDRHRDRADIPGPDPRPALTAQP